MKNNLIYLTRVSAFSSVVLLFSCSKEERGDALSVENERGATTSNERPALKTWQEIKSLMQKVKHGDHEAAYSLFRYYTFVESNATAAYFWAVQAQKLKHPLVGDDEVRSAEFFVWSVLPADESKSNEVDTENLPDLLKE